ncbi:MAG: class I SAM-dependent methyltransferase [Rhodospirillales bacterium]|nr:class I SAM-dependent methyltransferase [Rhodospirillales bacterium]
MGDLFRREAAATPAPFTGERLTGAIGGQVEIEHYHRYLFARAFCAGRDVLDVASGEGYGSAQLSQVARSVVGIEYDPATVAAAQRQFARDGLRYAQGDARALPLPDACVDVVVSFETIEHFDRQEAFVAEIRRVLRPGGLVICSTPDRDVYSGPNTPPNGFHVRELTGEEFRALLAAAFPHIAMLRQRPLVGSALLADAGTPAPPLVFDRRGESHFEACQGLPRAPYLVAVASDAPLPPLPSSLYIERSNLDDDGGRTADLLRRVTLTETVVRETREVLADTQAALAATQAREAEAREALDQAHAALRAQAAALESMERTRAEAEAVCRASVAARTAAEGHTTSALRELEQVRGSARTFLRAYLPRLRRHLFG